MADEEQLEHVSERVAAISHVLIRFLLVFLSANVMWGDVADISVLEVFLSVNKL